VINAYTLDWGNSVKTLKLALAGATFLVAASAVANAADVYSRGGSTKDAPVDYLPAITWTGFYVGGHAGAFFSGSTEIDGVEQDEEDDSVGLAGVHVGYNWQRPDNIVLGIEGDISFPFDKDDFGADYLATLRGRLGYAFGKSLVYATGGLAYISVDDEDLGDDSDTGFTVGAGFEHKLRDNLSFGVEGAYYAFEDDSAGEDVESDFWSVRARLTYHFGGHDVDPLK
jgi:outer membrane immunogenic protein